MNNAPTKNREMIMQILKIIGVCIFIWILTSINLQELLLVLKGIHLGLLGLSFVCIFVLYAFKAGRWHTLTVTAGGKPSYRESWRILNIGMFLGIVTPGKIGEFGKAAYLQKMDIPLKKGIGLSFIDRIADLVAILLFTLPSIYFLFGVAWVFVIILLFGACVCAILLLKKHVHIRVKIRSFIDAFITKISIKEIYKISACTMLGWIFYFMWAVLVAKSLGIQIPIHILVSVFTFTGILSMLPIAPSGLGTRDAALVSLLGPLGVRAEIAVALALIMFTSILCSSLLGAWYWVRNRI